MFADMLGSFLSSPQAQQATTALQAKGFSPEQVTGMFSTALPAAANAMSNATAGQAEPALGLFNIFGGHAGMEFLTGAVTGLLRGDGIVGSLEDGGMGAIGGHIGEVLAQRTGMNQRIAGEVAAVMTPFIVHFVHEQISGHPSVVAAAGESPHHKHHHHH